MERRGDGGPPGCAGTFAAGAFGPELSVTELSVPELSVVVPVHDEAANIAPLIAEIDAALGGRIEFEIVYVDDGSGDASAEELARARRRHPRLKVLRHRAQCGQSAA
ncbi:MAG: glycosyltransferase, partial [Proteobacteria bacterium]|nr:glycosyltransferase [Pseudomonadota bacterium]